jgi:hypothetical protein
LLGVRYLSGGFVLRRVTRPRYTGGS